MEGDLLLVLEVLNSKDEWDKVAVCGKIANITDPTKVGKNQLNLATAAIVNQTGTIPIEGAKARSAH